MVEAGLEDRRGSPVVLRRPEDDDRVGRPEPGCVVHGAAGPDAERRVGGQGDGADDREERDRGERPADRRAVGGAHRP
jgi:hypothetical protein